MKGFAKKSNNPVIGHLRDDSDVSIAVSYEHGVDEPFSCIYGSFGFIRAASMRELEEKIQKIQNFKIDWQDVIIVDITRRKSEGCPSESSTSVGFRPCHVAKNRKGQWVTATWSPGSITRQEIMCYNWPEELDLPATIQDYCYRGNITLILPYSEPTIARLKAFQVDVVDKHQALIDFLLENCKEAPKPFIDISEDAVVAATLASLEKPVEEAVTTAN